MEMAKGDGKGEWELDSGASFDVSHTQDRVTS